MNLNDIDYLLAVSEQRHVGRAAEALGLTQPALTRAIARLGRVELRQLEELRIVGTVAEVRGLPGLLGVNWLGGPRPRRFRAGRAPRPPPGSRSRRAA